MNAAVFMVTACLAGADPVPAAQPYGPVPVVVYGNGRGYGDCCGHSSVCGNCDAHQCCLSKLWSKLSCFNWNFCGSGCGNGHGCNLCGGHQTCAPACPQPKPVCQPCPKPVCQPCPKPVCQPCPKPAPVCQPCPKPVCQPCPKPVCNPCPKVECPKLNCGHTTSGCNGGCGHFSGCKLFSCFNKGSLCGGHSSGCHGGCGSTTTGCGSTTIAPGTVVPVAPPIPVAPKVMPEVPKPQVRADSPYSVVRPSLTTDGSAPKLIELGPMPTPF